MIKLESTSALVAGCLVSIQSQGPEAVVALLCEKARTLKDDKWVEDETRVKQILRAPLADGQVELEGIVPESDGITISAAWKVVCEVVLGSMDLPAFEAGRRGRSVVTAKLLRVVEVWASPSKALWRARDAIPAGSKTVDLSSDRISKP